VDTEVTVTTVTTITTITTQERKKMFKKCYLSPTISEKLGYSFTRVVNCVNGNPRYCIHFMAFLTEGEMFNQYRGDINGQYNLAHQRAKKLGYRKYTGKKFGGCFVGTSYNIENDAERIIDQREQTNLY
tara:strand:- start:384 stop:770 length:387 start_codon:yes stop_codon:yes gene_type:complete